MPIEKYVPMYQNPVSVYSIYLSNTYYVFSLVFVLKVQKYFRAISVT